MISPMKFLTRIAMGACLLAGATGPLRAQEALPDLVPLLDASLGWGHGWRLDQTTMTGRVLLRLATAMGNRGTGPLEVWGGTVSGSVQQVYQRVYSANGTVRDRLAGSFTYHPQHGHVHFDAFAIYNVRRVTPTGGVGAIIAAGQKTSFCLANIYNYWPAVAEAAVVKHGRGGSACGTIQGVSPGFADVYGSHLPDQWIDVTGVPTGDYWLEIIADPDNRLQETDETNNVVVLRIAYTNPVTPAPNRAPVATAVPAQSSVRGSAVNLPVTATDPDGQPVSFRAIGLPAGLSIGAGTGVISGTVANEAADTQLTTVIVTDGFIETSVSFTWTVTSPPPPPPPPNRAPQVFAPEAQIGRVGENANLAINATDADADALTYAAAGLPAGLVIDSRTGVITGTFTATGTHTVTLTVSDGRASATGSFAWTVNPGTAGRGLRGEYCNGRTFDRPVMIRTDAQVAFDWGGGSPGSGVEPDNFSVRWTGEILPEFTEDYTFVVAADNGCRLLVNGNLLVHDWDPALGENSGWHSATVRLTAGVRVPIRLEYYEAWGGAAVTLHWFSASRPWQVVPSERLYPAEDSGPQDYTPPTAELTTTATGVQRGPFRVELRFSEPVVGLTLSDFLLSSGSLSELTGSGTTWAVTVTPAATMGATLQLSSQAVSDAGGNGNLASNVLRFDSAPNRLPVIAATASPQVRVGDTVSLSLSASDPDGDALTWSATGLPPGLSLGAQTGVVTGSPTQTGSYTSTVNVADAFGGSGSLAIQWQVAAAGSAGLRAEYFAGRNFEQRVLTRVDERIAFDWGLGSPAPEVPVNDFTVRWSGAVTARFSGEHTFIAMSDNGVRVRVGNRLVIDAWQPDAHGTFTGTVMLTAGQPVPLQVEYREEGGNAGITLVWTSAQQGWEAIPASQLLRTPPAPSPAQLDAEAARVGATLAMRRAGAGWELTAMLPADRAIGIRWRLERSADLAAWGTAGGAPAEQVQTDGALRLRWSGLDDAGSRAFHRLVLLPPAP